ncbi:hypothetical protein [Bartonella raoultii]|nr:hypothetical protein [Bartonella raoultii]
MSLYLGFVVDGTKTVARKKYEDDNLLGVYDDQNIISLSKR